MLRPLLPAALLLAACSFDARGLRPAQRESGLDAIGGDRGPGDLPARDQVSDPGPPDRPAPDRLGPDLLKPDHSKADLAKPDLVKPDLAKPDLAKPALPIYTDALAPDWQSWSWLATVDLAGSSPVKAGSHAANVTFQPWGAFSPRKGTPLSTAGYTTLSFWVHGGAGLDKPLVIFTRPTDEGNESKKISVTAKAGIWTLVAIPLASVGSPTSIKRIAIQNDSSSNQPMVSVDELWLLP